ncbi:RIP metalloprotease RseP [Blattabacterium cuenoti]|uniref:RIP metalloprotease RseP n=1 Tax=Blattabacterium cuenoti TaxID=1653831 RepID=UPI00163D1EA1|nr:RIP metalloprotease RseP [Blattabacterium cuenoti]
MISIFIKTIQLIISISILIITHEFGHFFFSRLFKVRVERFFLFFDPWFSIFKKKIGKTIYGIGWIPLGGYVKISGMLEESSSRNKKQYNQNSDKFYSKSAIKRFLIIFGGILFNTILSIIIFSIMLFQYGEMNLLTKNVKYGIEVDSVGKKIGLKNGDKILSVDGKHVKYFHEIPKCIIIGKTITIDRMGNMIKLFLDSNKKRILFDSKKPFFMIKPRIPPIIKHVMKNSEAEKCGFMVNDEIISVNSQPILFYDQLQDILIKNQNKELYISVNRKGSYIQKKIFFSPKKFLGIYLKNFINMNDIFSFEKKNFTIIDSIYYGCIKSWNVIKNQIYFFQHVFHIENKAYNQIGSFFSMIRVFPPEWKWSIFWNITANLSIWIAFLNLFPIPSLDGGYILFILIELFSGRRLNTKFIERCTIIGFMILSLMMIIIIIWDIFKIFVL